MTQTTAGPAINEIAAFLATQPTADAPKDRWLMYEAGSIIARASDIDRGVLVAELLGAMRWNGLCLDDIVRLMQCIFDEMADEEPVYGLSMQPGQGD